MSNRSSSPLRPLAPLLALLSLFLPLLALAAAPKLDSGTLGGLVARPIGPATMSGRILAIDAVEKDPRVVWVGTASGGIWKSTNGGVTFKSVFDKYDPSIGALAIDPSKPDTVWAGTGESCTRNSVSVGSGIYRTTDGGDSWKNLGLAKSERISRIAIVPSKPDTVFVAVPGALWSSSPERGLFRTTDAGTTWEKVLSVDETTGVSDVVLDPQEPSIVYASSWQFRRTAWDFKSGGPGSGIWKSTDGGKGWRRLQKGLPAGPLGRIALAVAPSRPSTVYATVECAKSGLYVSHDFGESWSLASTNASLGARPFYFSHLAVDPKDPKRIYKPGFYLAWSNDGGETWSGSGGSFHSDLHALWIDPGDTNHLLLGTDGGVSVSNDRGNSWRFLRNLPVSQFYEVAVDDERPYNVYGGLQDNGSWQAPSDRSGGIRNSDWKNVGMGDGFFAFPDPADRDIVYAEFQGGNLLRRHRSTGETKEIVPFPAAGEPKLRFNWNTPFLASPADPKVLFVGAQYLFRSSDKGESWERLSPDLTTNDPAKQQQERSGGLTIDNSTAENHCTIVSIGPSPVDPSTIWVGTDDGNLQVTRDGGKSWTNVIANVGGVPKKTWVSRIEPSRQDAAIAFVAFDGHMSGDMAPRLHRTTDGGKSWTSIVGEGLEGFVHVVRQDPVRPDLLFAGTESGLFATLDGGARWIRWGSSFPHVPVRDLAIQKREGDLVVATHGRGIWIVDDLTPLRQLDAATMAKPVAFLGSRPARIELPEMSQEFTDDTEFVGDGTGSVAEVCYWLAERHLMGDISLEIVDADGKLVSKLPAGTRKGLNRVPWAMRKKPPKVARGVSLAGRAIIGPSAPEGSYTARLTKNGELFTGTVEVVADPRLPHSKEDRLLQQKTVLFLYDLAEEVAWLDARATETRDALRLRTKEKKGAGLAPRAEELARKLDALHATLTATRDEGMLTGEEQLRERVTDLYGAVSSFAGAPSRSQLTRRDALVAETAAATRKLEDLFAKELAPINRKLVSAGLAAIEPVDRESFRTRE
jgi:photosystem II stability/assembly factor-like uncharacterized protein